MINKEKPFGMLVGRMIDDVFRVLKRRTGEQTEEKLTVDQFGLLYAIHRQQEEVIQKDMAGIMGKDKSAILRIIDILEDKGLVRRVVDTCDRRKNYIMVTKKGEKVIDQYLDIEFELAKDLEVGLSESDLETFYKVIEHFRCKAQTL